MAVITEASIYKFAKDNGWDGGYADDETGGLLAQYDIERMFGAAKPANSAAPPNGVYDVEKMKSLCLSAEKFIGLELPPRRKYLDPWIREQAIILLTGDRGTGKSRFIAGILNSITKGFSFGPWATTQSVHCLLYDAELVPQDIQGILNSLDRGEKRDNELYILSDAILVEKGHMPKGNLQSPEWRAVMKKLLLNLDIRVWVLDNIASASTGPVDENSSTDWRDINGWLLDLRFAGITTILLHHTNKSGGPRGTHSREDNIDISIMLKRPTKYRLTDGASFDVVFTKARLPNRDLAKISDVNFRLTEDPDGKAVWENNKPKHDLQVEIIQLSGEGLSQKKIADKVGCSPQNVSSTIIKAKKNGWVKDKGTLTPKGGKYINGPFNED